MNNKIETGYNLDLYSQIDIFCDLVYFNDKEVSFDEEDIGIGMG